MIDLTVPQFLDLIPNYVIDIAEKLQNEGFEAYLVGGSIRDVLLGKIPSDFDIATNAYPEDIQRIFVKSIPVGAKFGTIVVVSEDEKGEKFDVEVTTYRSEADYFGGRWPAKIEFAKTIEEDLMRRDFTINSIALNLQHFDESGVNIQEILVDPFDGISDMRSKLIRAVRDPLERFSEDGLRCVRACRLASQLEFEIENKTFDAIKKTLHITKQVSIERFREELDKLLLRSPKPSVGLNLLKDSGILELFIPEILEGVGVFQPEYHAFDVWTHTLAAVDAAEDDVKLATLFHDIGKPRTKTVDEKGTHFYGHDIVGEKLTQEIMRRLRYPNNEIDTTSKLVRWHMFNYPSADWREEKVLKGETHDDDTFFEDENDKNIHGWTDGAIRRLINAVGGEENIEKLMRLRLADASGNPKYDYNPKELEALSNRISEVRASDMALKISDLDISGNDLMEEFDLEPGRKIGIILAHLLEIVLDDPLKNKKETLLEIARGKLNDLKS